MIFTGSGDVVSHGGPKRGRFALGTAFAFPVVMSPDGTDELRVSVRERLADGRLPWASGSSTVRQGTGRPCNVCGRAIAKGSLEREVPGERGAYALAHDDCYRIWREELQRVQSPPPPP